MATAARGVRSSTRQADIQAKLKEDTRIENEKKRKHELSQKWSILHKILEDEGGVRIYPFPQTWQSNLEKKYIKTKTPEEQYDLIKEYFEVFSKEEFDCSMLQDAYSRQPTSDLTYHIGRSLKVSMFLYLTIFNIHYRNNHRQEILKPDNQDDLIKLLCILECFIKRLYNSVEIRGNSEEDIILLWQEDMPYLDIEGLKTVINAQSNVSEKVRTQFSYLLELTEIFFGKDAVKINSGEMTREVRIPSSPIFQHLMKDNKKLIVLLFDLLKNTDHSAQRKNDTYSYLHPEKISPLVGDDFIYSLIYSPIFRLTVLFSKYLKTGNLNFLSSAIPPRVLNIGDLYNLLVEINNTLGSNGENSMDVEGNQNSFLTKIQKLITEYNSINRDSGDLSKLSEWLVELDDLVYNSDDFQQYLDIQQQPGAPAFKQLRRPGGAGDKKNKELEKEIKKISRNALKILKKKELIKEKIKKIDNKLKELDNKKKELSKIYKTKKNKVLKDKIDKTIKNINKEKLNKSEKKKELKNTSNEYKKIDKELKKMDKVLKKLKIKNNKEKLKKAKK